jgi:short-subunit dehydrogenase
MRLAEAVVLLTGASGGIGLHLVQQLCAAGARVLAIGRRSEALQPLLQQYPQQLRWQAAELRSHLGRQQVVEAALAMGGVNLLINAAGVNHFSLFEQIDEEPLRQMLELNLHVPLQLTRLLLPVLREQPQALIVNLGSTYGSIGYPGYASYCASKHALRGFSEALRRELADTQVDVLYVAPRATRTGMNGSAAMALNRSLNIRMDAPADVARALLAAVQRQRGELYLGWPEKLAVRLNSLLPGLIDRVLRQQLPLIRRHADVNLREHLQ